MKNPAGPEKDHCPSASKRQKRVDEEESEDADAKESAPEYDVEEVETGDDEDVDFLASPKPGSGRKRVR